MVSFTKKFKEIKEELKRKDEERDAKKLELLTKRRKEFESKVGARNKILEEKNKIRKLKKQINKGGFVDEFKKGAKTAGRIIGGTFGSLPKKRKKKQNNSQTIIIREADNQGRIIQKRKKNRRKKTKKRNNGGGMGLIFPDISSGFKI